MQEKDIYKCQCHWKTGLEGYEKELKGENGCKIYIADSEGKEKEQLAYKIVKDGKDIKLTIDADLLGAII